MLLLACGLLAIAAAATASDEQDSGLSFDWDSHIEQVALQQNSTVVDGCEQACKILDQLLPRREFDPLSTAYFKEQSFYWSSQQAEVSPHCFVQPTSAQDVVAIVKTVRRFECSFAVKSGGHAAFAGSSNIQDGVTIDLSLLDELQLSEDQLTTRVGPGNRWTDVYAYLDPQHVSVVGGRVAEVGVGGLVLGGGISFFSGRYGWALDGVRNYEVVTASGDLLEVNYESYPDLYWALRGGGNNFGIITRFDLETFSQGPMWGGAIMSGIEANRTLLSSFTDFAAHSAKDLDAQVYVALVWAQQYGQFFLVTQLSHAKPTFLSEGTATAGDGDQEIEWPDIFANFSTAPRVQSTLRRTNMHDLADEVGQSCPNGLRETYWTWTLRLDEDLLTLTTEAWHEGQAAVSDAAGMVAAIAFQHLPPHIITHFARNGGNALGITPDEGPLVVVNLNFMWADAADDELVFAAARRVMQRSVDEARRRGLDHHYLYQNYAAAEQPVFAGYGEANLRRLRDISRKYDPDQVFQRLQPGYFKL